MKFVPSEVWFETPGQSLAEALVMGASRALGIEDNELEGGFRARSAEHADVDARGVIEIFLFDTTAGGAGFSSRVWEEFSAVCEEARSILENCSCDTACHNCLRRYQNRHLHDSLNRHEGLALLDYAQNGTPPTLRREKEQSLIQQLERALELKEEDVALRDIEDGKWEIEIDGSTMTFGVRSSLRRPRDPESEAYDEDYSDYELSQRLPEVAHSIVDQLQ
jgi:ATP-dependent helicase YprA (DUF1998 family)